jgi:alpha-L-fucosidase 2
MIRSLPKVGGLSSPMMVLYMTTRFLRLSLLIFASIVIFPIYCPADGAGVTVTITQRAPIESLSASGEVLGVTEAPIGIKLTLVSTDGSKVILQDAQGGRYRIASGATDYAPPVPAATSALTNNQAQVAQPITNPQPTPVGLTSANTTPPAPRPPSAAQGPDSITQNQALRIVQKYTGVFLAPPAKIVNPLINDAPLLGNGDLGVAILGNIDAMTFILSKNEFWSLKEGRVKTMARLNLSVSGMAGASYRMEEDLAKAEVRGTFSLDQNAITTTSWVQADDTMNNPLFTILANNGSQPQQISVSLEGGHKNPNPSTVGSSSDVLYIDVNADSVDTVGGFQTCKVRVATRVIGVTSVISSDILTFTLNPGQSAILMTSTVSDYDSASYLAQAIDEVSSKTPEDVSASHSTQEAYWASFYSKSFVEIPDKRLEAEWYASLYLMASCCRAGESPPGLFGNWIAENPPWNGDYTLNYNYEAPFYLAMPTNHPELSDNYDKPIIDWLPNAEALAKKRGWTGAYYQVHIGPLPNGSADKGEHNQKFCGAFAATPIIMRYYYTRDPAYAQRVYPALKQIAIFWQNDLFWDGTRYVIKNDAQQEDDASPQDNGVMSLGLVRFFLQGCIAMSSDLQVDSSLRAIWQDHLDKLSAFPTFERKGETVFRWTEVGRDWCGGNTIGIQHIYPGSQIGLDSDSDLLHTAQNMVHQMSRWEDGNGTNTFYPAAARVGYDPNIILQQMSMFVQKQAYPNFYIHTSGGGVESFNVVPSGICEMLLQSFQGKIRIFPDWPSDATAKFGDLMAYDGFLISSSIDNGSVQYVRIISKIGKRAVLVNPWPGQSVGLYRNGDAAETLSGTELTLPTSANESILLAPSGTSMTSILSQMQAPTETATTPRFLKNE